MTKTLRIAAIAATFAIAGTSIAQMAATTSKTTTTTTKPTVGPSKAVVNAKSNTAATVVSSNGHMVTTKTSTGKTITYDCSKAGNKTKTVCKGK